MAIGCGVVVTTVSLRKALAGGGGAAPVNTVAPVASLVGSSFSTTNGTWINSPTGYTYQWRRNGSAISGATASAFTKTSADFGSDISVIVTATNASGSGQATSNAISVPALPVNSVAPSISGTAQVGQTLTASTGTWSGSPTYTYQWKADGANISGATASTFVLTGSQVGAAITVTVTATNASGSASATSSATSAVLPLAPVNSVLPTISGTAQVGQTLTASTGTWTNSPTGYSYQWRADGADISGATSSTIVLTVAQLGVAITVAVTASNAGGSTVATSSATSAVSNVAAAFTMTQLSEANRVYQRDTLTGGSYGKGAGTIPITVNVTSAGTIYARTRAADGSTITQTPWLAVSNATVANGPVNITGVEARPDSFYLDLSPDGTTWGGAKNGTVLVFMGQLWMIAASQSYTANALKNPYLPSDDTLATAGFSPAANTWARVGAMSGWAQFSDGSSTINSIGGAWWLNKAAQASGVAVGLIGHAVGGTTVEDWAVGNTSTNYLSTALTQLTAAGGKAEIIYSQLGHSNIAGAGSISFTNQMADYAAYSDGSVVQGYVTKLNAIIDAVKAANAFSNPTIMLGTIPAPAGAAGQGAEAIRRAVADYVAAKAYVDFSNTDNIQVTDGSHPTGKGMMNQSESAVRAAQGNLAGAPQFPLTMTRGTPSGGNVDYTIVLTKASGATLSLVGDIKPLLSMWKRGDRTAANRITINAVSLSGTTLTVNVVDPGDVPVEILPFAFINNSDSAARNNRLNNIFDDDTMGGMLPSGRAIKLPVRPIIYKPSSLSLGIGTITYSSSGTGPFGGTTVALASGYGITPMIPTADLFAGTTIFFRWKQILNAASARYIMGSSVTGYQLQVQLQTSASGVSGAINLNFSSSTTLTIPAANLTFGAWNTIKIMKSQFDQLIRVKVNDVLLTGAGQGQDRLTSIASLGTTPSQLALGGSANSTMTGLTGSNMGTYGLLADVGFFSGMQDFAVSNSAYLNGSETGLLYRMPLNGTNDILLN